MRYRQLFGTSSPGRPGWRERWLGKSLHFDPFSNQSERCEVVVVDGETTSTVLSRLHTAATLN
ncbi:hypothetical protein E2C01_033613 [Portunus trituberculatus]|uniref:Uncharacterized protein n=1 Tax=Portunus trituberculatus TaxID=210409 RepID=A0A5B7EYD6_PORTR|nr:hypothetical protein [Portunus trituberculatus]